MTDVAATWERVRAMADELELQIHLAEMDARDRWHALQPRLAHLEHTIAHSGQDAGEAISDELAEVATAVRDLRNEVVMRARGDFATGW